MTQKKTCFQHVQCFSFATLPELVWSPKTFAVSSSILLLVIMQQTRQVILDKYFLKTQYAYL